MPQCQQCGTELRPGARFCNRCGAVQQPPAAQPVGPSTGQGADVSVDEAARAKRPPRIQRTHEEGEPATATGAPVTAQQPAVSGGPALGAQAPQSGGPAAAAIEHEMPSLAAAESGAASLTSPPPTSSEAPEPPATVAPDGLAWPLPTGAIVADRYRVEALLSAAPTPADENVYRVSDQRGFERCWSCGATQQPEVGQPPEQYCPQCGADMLARPYLLRERLLPVEQTAAPMEIPPDAFREEMRLYSVAPQEVERSAFPLGAHLVIASASDIGRERAAGQNEDSVAQFVLQIEHASRAEPLALGMVADGLGGHSSGSEASQMVVQTVLAQILRELSPLLLALPSAAESAPPTDDTFKQALRESITAANAALHAANAASQRDMGSTIVAALIWGETAYIANVGDSRAYVFDGTELRRITADHSLVEQLVAGGMIPPEERYTHPSRNQIYRSLGVGSGDELTVDLYTQRLHPGMRLLLCSDGLWEMVRDDELAHILRETPHPQGACDALVAAANAHGGEDNISALVIDVTG